jgi:hypothetical protein
VHYRLGARLSNLDAHLINYSSEDLVLELVDLFIRQGAVHAPIVQSIAFTLPLGFGVRKVVNLDIRLIFRSMYGRSRDDKNRDTPK